MLLRFDFDEKFNSLQFKKQIRRFIKSYKDLQLVIYCTNYLIEVSILDQNFFSNHSSASIQLYEIDRDSSGSLTYKQEFYISSDSKFNSFKAITDLFGVSSQIVYLYSDEEHLVNIIYDLVKVLHKVSNLKVFL